METYFNALAMRLRNLHRKATDHLGREFCEHCAELCHSYEGLSCDSPDAPWPCYTIQELEKTELEDRPE